MTIVADEKIAELSKRLNEAAQVYREVMAQVCKDVVALQIESIDEFELANMEDKVSTEITELLCYVTCKGCE